MHVCARQTKQVSAHLWQVATLRRRGLASTCLRTNSVGNCIWQSASFAPVTAKENTHPLTSVLAGDAARDKM